MLRRQILTILALSLGLLGAAPSTVDRQWRPSGFQRAVLWAWERPEDLRFAGSGMTVAVLAGTIRLSGDSVVAVPRLQPAQVLPTQAVAGVVHLEIDQTRPLNWDQGQRSHAAAATLSLLANPRFQEVQVDFEVRASQRAILLDLLADVRRGLPPDKHLSMTALASWCDSETWIETAPVDEVVPMLFRMGPAGAAITRRLTRGGDFHESRCRNSIGIATDTPPSGIPDGRRVWIFNPRAWTPDDLTGLQGRLHA